MMKNIMKGIMKNQNHKGKMLIHQKINDGALLFGALILFWPILYIFDTFNDHSVFPYPFLDTLHPLVALLINF